MQINLSNIALVFSLLASIMVPVGAYYAIKSDVKVLQTQITNQNSTITLLQNELIELRKSQYEAVIRINRNSAIVKQLDRDGTITKQVIALDHHKGVK